MTTLEKMLERHQAANLLAATPDIRRYDSI